MPSSIDEERAVLNSISSQASGVEEPELFAMIENFMKINQSRENQNHGPIYSNHGSNYHVSEQAFVNGSTSMRHQNFYHPSAASSAPTQSGPTTSSVANVALTTNSNHEFYAQQLPMVPHKNNMPPPPGFENFEYGQTAIHPPLSGDSTNHGKHGSSSINTLNAGHHPEQNNMNQNNDYFYSQQVPMQSLQQMNSNYGPMQPTLIFNPMLGQYESMNQMSPQFYSNNCPQAAPTFHQQPSYQNNPPMNHPPYGPTTNYYPSTQSSMMNPNFLHQQQQQQQTMQNVYASAEEHHHKTINYGQQHHQNQNQNQNQQQHQKFNFYNRHMNHFRKHNQLLHTTQQQGRPNNNNYKKNKFHHPHMKSSDKLQGRGKKMFKSWSMDRTLTATDRDDLTPVPITFYLDGEHQFKTPTLTLNAWSPFSQNMITGVQEITTRSYPLPQQCKNVPIGIVEIIPSASADYRHPALVGEVIFSGDKKYSNQDEWEIDSDKHGNDVLHHYERNKSRTNTPPKWGWIIKEFKTYDKKIMDISMDHVDNRINYVHNFFMWDYKMKVTNKTSAEKLQN